MLEGNFKGLACHLRGEAIHLDMLADTNWTLVSALMSSRASLIIILGLVDYDQSKILSDLFQSEYVVNVTELQNCIT